MTFPKILAKLTGYDAVEKRNKGRSSVSVERKTEDEILNAPKRAQLVATQRDGFRNTTFLPSTAHQLRINAIGNEGGRLTLTSPDEAWNGEAGRAFRKWAKHCGFTEGMSLNEILKLCLTQLTHNGGDFIAVFDDGILTGGRGSGKIRVFESDEIKNVEPGEFERLYGKGSRYSQQNGVIVNPYGQICGAFVSARGRNHDEFKPGEYLHLRLDTPADFTDSPWILVGNRWRCNQIRGISTATHVTNLLQDIADTRGSEVQAAKLNSGLGIVVTDTAPDISQSGTRGWSDDSDPNACYDTAGSDAASEEAENSALRQASTRLVEGQSAVIKLGLGKDIKSFDTNRPNLNTVEFLGRMQNEAGTVFGLGPTFTTLDPNKSYSAARAEIQLAWRSFADLEKKIERDFLDWVGIRALNWLGFSNEDLDTFMFWSWPDMFEIDEGAAQSAIEKQFTNFETTLQSRHGADWKRVVDQIAAEQAYCAERGILHPSMRTVSGGVVTDGMVTSSGMDGEEQEASDDR